MARLAPGLRLNVHLFPDLGSAVWSRPVKKALGGTNGSGSEIAEHSPSTTYIPCKLKPFARASDRFGSLSPTLVHVFPAERER